jgi:nitrilase
MQMVSDAPRSPATCEAAARSGAPGCRRRRQARACCPSTSACMGRRDTDKLEVAEDDSPAGRRPHPALPDARPRPPRRCGSWAARCRCACPAAATACATRCLVHGPQGERAGALRQDPPLRLRQRARVATTRAACWRPARSRWRFTAEGHRVGLSVCYDLRFPELYRALACAPGQSPCDLMCVPAAFTHTTGQAHWELLLRARAVEEPVPTCWPRRRAGCTRTAAAPGATA